MARYLSPQWITALDDEIRGRPQLQAAAHGRSVGITQVVEGGPGGTVTYHVRADGTDLRCGPGPAEPEDLRFVEQWHVAQSVAMGVTNAQDAFIKGHIRFHGDQQVLLDHLGIFEALGAAVSAVRAATTFEPLTDGG